MNDQEPLKTEDLYFYGYRLNGKGYFIHKKKTNGRYEVRPGVHEHVLIININDPGVEKFELMVHKNPALSKCRPISYLKVFTTKTEEDEK